MPKSVELFKFAQKLLQIAHHAFLLCEDVAQRKERMLLFWSPGLQTALARVNAK